MSNRPLLARATAFAAALFIAICAAALGDDDPTKPLSVVARCTIDAAQALEPLGDFAQETVWSTHARCTATSGPLRGARADVDGVWAFDRGGLEGGPIRWLGPQGVLSLPAFVSTLRREGDGGWLTEFGGVVAAGSGAAARWAGRRYQVVARFEGPRTVAPGAVLSDDGPD